MRLPTLASSLAALALCFTGCGDPDEGETSAFKTGSGSGESSESSEADTNMTGPDMPQSTSTTDPSTSTTDPSTSTTDPSTSTTDPSTSTTSTTGGGGCGNGTIDMGEQCDGGNLNGLSCVDLGFSGGTLACDSVTCTYDSSNCTTNPGTTG